jgi:hypothetical protein
MNIPTEPIGSIPRPQALIDALAKTHSEDPALDPLYNKRDSGHHQQVRGNGLTGRHGWRAAEVPQLLDVQRRRAFHDRARRLQDPVRRGSRAPHAAADCGSFQVTTLRRFLPGHREALCDRAAQAGGDIAVRAQPVVSIYSADGRAVDLWNGFGVTAAHIPVDGHLGLGPSPSAHSH